MMRLDRALAASGLVRSRSEAQALLSAGQIRVDGQTATKASLLVEDTACLAISGERCPYVSRGGLKLAAALDAFLIPVAGRLAMDVGASTGGFTDCLLQRGIRQVVAVDAGRDQMAPKVASDLRVERHDMTNARGITAVDFPTPFDLMAVDVSFISLTLILPALVPLLHAEGDIVALVKPQFEVGKEHLGKGGIVRSCAQREAAVQKVIACASELHLKIAGRITSPLLGTEGNEEYLLWMKKENW